jgi:hypothetical protein
VAPIGLFVRVRVPAVWASVLNLDDQAARGRVPQLELGRHGLRLRAGGDQLGERGEREAPVSVRQRQAASGGRRAAGGGRRLPQGARRGEGKMGRGVNDARLCQRRSCLRTCLRSRRASRRTRRRAGGWESPRDTLLLGWGS